MSKKELSWFLRDKFAKPHEYVNSLGEYYVSLAPYALYRINGKEISYIENYFRYVIHELGDTWGKIEIFNHNLNRWDEVDLNDKAWKGGIFKDDIERAQKKYGEHIVKYDNKHNYGFMAFNISKYVSEQLDNTLVVDLNHNKYVRPSTGESWKSTELRDWEEKWRNFDNDCIVFHDLSYLDQTIRYITEEVSKIPKSDFLENLYAGVKSGEIDYNTFVEKLRG